MNSDNLSNIKNRQYKIKPEENSENQSESDGLNNFEEDNQSISG